MNAKKQINSYKKSRTDPIGGAKEHFDVASRDLKHKPPEADTSAQEAALEATRLQQAELDEEENRRRKRLFAQSTGARGFRGSAMFRRRASDSSGSSSASTASAATRPGRVASGLVAAKAGREA